MENIVSYLILPYLTNPSSYIGETSLSIEIKIWSKEVLNEIFHYREGK